MGTQGLHWSKEDTPRWDTGKQRMFGPAELAAVGFSAPAPDEPMANEWWRVSDDGGTVLGYGWCVRAELPACGSGAPAREEPMANEWWRVSDDDGTVLGYGWLDSEWGDAEITFLVDPARRGAGGRAVIRSPP